jgi:hypothetical protein
MFYRYDAPLGEPGFLGVGAQRVRAHEGAGLRRVLGAAADGQAVQHAGGVEEALDRVVRSGEHLGGSVVDDEYRCGAVTGQPARGLQRQVERERSCDVAGLIHPLVRPAPAGTETAAPAAEPAPAGLSATFDAAGDKIVLTRSPDRHPRRFSGLRSGVLMGPGRSFVLLIMREGPGWHGLN